MHGGENDDAEVCAPDSQSSFRGAPKARARNPETSGLPALLDSGFAASRRPRNDRGGFGGTNPSAAMLGSELLRCRPVAHIAEVGVGEQLIEQHDLFDHA